MTTFDSAYEAVKELVQRFEKGLQHYISPQYQESEVRQDFIDDFFIALGWDVRHREQQNPYEQEVKIEKSQKQQEAKAQKRADYAFYLAPNFKDEKFFVEAKKPSVGLKNPDHYFQTIRYGWSANIPVSILTDFEEFHIVDCRIKPDIRYVFNGSHKEFTYKDYLDKDKFSEIYWIFSREAVLKDSIEKYVNTLPQTKGKSVQKALFKGGYKPIDDDFLEYIDGIREDLAKAFKKNDENLNGEELTEAVQRTIDRLVFIRFLEDKLIEPVNHVSEWTGWNDFVSDCRKLDAKYNGVVFKKHFIDDQNFAGAEEKLFRSICADISNLNSPYQFNYLPIHILGSIYERFLGKIVVSTPKRVHIEEKPEVRKAGGVYYTPKYIVDYIVSNTIGNLIRNKSPKEVSFLRFADIACGSGSFLIGVYDLLLDYHKKYYNEKLAGKNEIDKRSEDFENTFFIDGQWNLTLKLKQEILLNNIYGVDIDAQAVEVTQLSLFLKMLEDESVSSTQVRQGSMFSKVLPDLSRNISCGNSLVDFDLFERELYDSEVERKLNPFDFKSAFPNVFKNGGFDVIVGNPPYSAKQSIDNKKMLKVYRYVEYKCDPYAFFIERAYCLLKRGGKLGYITPLSWLTNVYYRKIRKLVIDTNSLDSVIRIEGLVFKNANIDTSLIFLQKDSVTKNAFDYSHNKINELGTSKFIRSYSDIKKEADYSISSDGDSVWLNLKSKIDGQSESLSKIAKISLGLKLRSNDEFISVVKSSTHPNPIVFGKDISKYSHIKPLRFFNFSEAVIVGGTKNPKIQTTKVKIFIQAIRNLSLKDRIIATIDEEGMCFVGTVNALTFYNEDTNPKYILGLLNSKLHNVYFKKRFTTISLTAAFLGVLPIKVIKSEADENIKNDIVNLVTQIIETKKLQIAAKVEKDILFYENKGAAMERKIDELVYKLFDLTEDEISLIENG